MKVGGPPHPSVLRDVGEERGMARVVLAASITGPPGLCAVTNTAGRTQGNRPST
jgi:hypothetical protein